MNGILCINKPADFTSFDVIAKARGITRERKMGHAGTLDPMATGVLPIFLGSSTKAIGLLEDETKEYIASFKLGFVSDTEDIWGNVTSCGEVQVTTSEVLAVLARFRGKIKQIPPMYSAIQVDGRRLYDLARSGIVIEREAREIEVFNLELLEEKPDNEYVIRVECSKGSYIRTICADIGAALGVGAVMTSLIRTRSCGFTLEDCTTLEELQKIRDNDGEFPILPLEIAFSSLPKLTVAQTQAVRFVNGAPLSLNRLRSTVLGDTALFAPDGLFLGIGKVSGDSLVVKKVLVSREEFAQRYDYQGF